jgi:predicted  nucleic acid-binding Zn-ribbon protein
MIAEFADIRFKCTECGQHLVVESAGVGLTADCPICNTTVTVPKRSSRPAASEPELARSNDAHESFSPGASLSPYADPREDELRDELIDASLLNGRLQRELERMESEFSKAQLQLKAATEECERLNASATHTQVELKSFQSDRQQVKAELAAFRQRLATAEMQLAARERELAQARAHNGEWEARAFTLQAAFDEACVARDQIAESLQFGNERLANTNHEVASLQAHLSGAQEEIERLNAVSAELTRQLEQTREPLLEAVALKAKLARTEDECIEALEKLQSAEQTCKSLSVCCEELQRESESLRQDLKQSPTGTELVGLRASFKSTLAERDTALARLSLLEAEVQALKATELKQLAEVEEARKERAEALRKLEEASESRYVKDNEVLRGIVARQNTELAQRSGEIYRFKRARLGLKIVYGVFAVGVLGVVAFAIKILPQILRP